ncbi:MAG: DUF2341 domain-containing protein [Bacteroidales bacterium]|nr:DUF2341 domain-containing protein [Bacteroidales bacterium]
MKKLFTLLFILMAIGAFAQYNGMYRMPVSISNDTSITFNNYPVKLIVETDTLIGAGKLQINGEDLRFSPEKCAPTIFYNYYIEDYINTDSTIIWVNLPDFSGDSTYMIYMHYGDTTATAMSDFSLTFPNAYISSGNDTLDSLNVYDWFEISAGDTVFTTANDSMFEIRAAIIIIDGVLHAQGNGFQITGAGLNGSGPGYGTYSSSCGASGAGYGGDGGDGGYDTGDPIQTGGIAYGTATGFDIQMGSSGGSASTTIGGNGGGKVILFAEEIIVNGYINANGNDAQQPGGGQGSGGGAGGGVLIYGAEVNLSGTIDANGGQGSIGTSTANDDGGSGGGGRIKLFGENINNSGAMYVNGGPATLYGGAAPGEAGSIGSINEDTIVFFTSFVFSAEENAYIELGVTSMDPVLTSNATGAAYQWVSCDSAYAIIPGETNQSFTATANGDYAVIVSMNGCADTSACHTISTIVSLEESTLDLSQVYPNPTNSEINIELGKKYDFVQVQITNYMGQIVSDEVYRSVSKITSSINGEAGIYFINVLVTDKEYARFKVIKN